MLYRKKNCISILFLSFLVVIGPFHLPAQTSRGISGNLIKTNYGRMGQLPHDTSAAVEILNFRELFMAFPTEDDCPSLWKDLGELRIKHNDERDVSIEIKSLLTGVRTNEKGTNSYVIRLSLDCSVQELTEVVELAVENLKKNFFIRLNKSPDKAMWSNRDSSLSATVVENELVITFDSTPEEWGLAAGQKLDKTLANTRTFKRASTYLAKQNTVNYFVAARHLKKLLANQRKVSGNRTSTAFAESCLADFVAFCGGLRIDNRGESVALDLTILPALPAKNLSQLLLLSPINTTKTVEVPANSSFHCQFGINPKAFYQGLEGTVDSSLEMGYFKKQIASARNTYQVDSAHLIQEMITGQVNMSFAYDSTTPFIGFPFEFAIGIRDLTYFENALETINMDSAVEGTRESREHKGFKYYGDSKLQKEKRLKSLQKSYKKWNIEWKNQAPPETVLGVIDSYLLLCYSDDRAKSFIEAGTDPSKALSQDPNYKATIAKLVNSDIDSPICGIAYFSNGDFLRYILTSHFLNKTARQIKSMGVTYLGNTPNGYDRIHDFVVDFPINKIATLIPSGGLCVRVDQTSSVVSVRVIFNERNNPDGHQD